MMVIVRDSSSKNKTILCLQKNGFFVECGAYDGEMRSNTLVLERKLGWNGLLVEADPINFSKMLLKNRKAYLTPTCLGIEPYPTVVREFVICGKQLLNTNLDSSSLCSYLIRALYCSSTFRALS